MDSLVLATSAFGRNVLELVVVLGVIILIWFGLDWGKAPESLKRIVQILLVIVAIVFSCNFLLSLIDRAFISF